MEAEQTASFVRNFNPLLEAGAVRWPTRRAMYEPLIIWNPLTGQWVPWLAERWAWSEDRTRLSFTVRPDVRWSDGHRFSARDVAFTFDLLRRHAALDAKGLWPALRSVTALDDHHVEVVLLRPNAPLLEQIGQQAIVPQHLWSQVADPVTFTNDRPVATGPFTEIVFFGAQAYEVGRNPHYWQPGRPGLRALRFRAHPGNEQAILALLHGELDWAGTFMPAIDRVFRQRNPQHHHYWFPLLDSTVFLYANTARPPLDDVRVRQAISMGIDRRRIADIPMHGYTRPADGTGLSDAYAHHRDPSAVKAGAGWVAYDPAGAARLLDQSGLRRPRADAPRGDAAGRTLALAVEVPAGFSDWISAAQMAARDLRQLGLEVTIRTLEYNAWFERLQRGDFHLSMGWSDLWTTPYGFYRPLLSRRLVQPLGVAAAESWHRFGLPEADRLLDALESAASPEEERRHLSGLQHLFATHAPAIPLFPGPLWGEFNSRRATGFPDAGNPYAPLSPNIDGPQPLLVLTRLEPRP